MEIREIKEKDLNDLMELYIQLSPTNIGLSYEKREEIWADVENNNITYLGVFDDNKLISSCFIAIIPNLTNQGKAIGYIENVITDIKYRRKGIGKMLLTKAIEIAKENNCFKVFLESGINRVDAHKFYQSIGFDGSNKKPLICDFNFLLGIYETKFVDCENMKKMHKL